MLKIVLCQSVLSYQNIESKFKVDYYSSLKWKHKIICWNTTTTNFSALFFVPLYITGKMFLVYGPPPSNFDCNRMYTIEKLVIVRETSNSFTTSSGPKETCLAIILNWLPGYSKMHEWQKSFKYVGVSAWNGCP